MVWYELEEAPEHGVKSVWLRWSEVEAASESGLESGVAVALAEFVLLCTCLSVVRVLVRQCKTVWVGRGSMEW